MSAILKISKYSLFAFLSYTISTTILAGIMMSVWLSYQETVNLTSQQISALANQSITIQLISGVIGFAATFIISYVLCKKTLKDGLTTIKAFAVVLTLFSILGILLNHEHHVIYQVVKLISPAIICMLSFKLASRHSGRKLVFIEEHTN